VNRRGWLWLTLALGLATLPAFSTEIVFFYEVGCPHCARVQELLDRLAGELPELVVRKYEIRELGAFVLLERLLSEYGAERGPVPILFVGDVALVGDTFYGLGPQPEVLPGRAGELTLERVIREAVATGAPSPLEKIPQTATEVVFARGPGDQELETLVLEWAVQYPEVGVRELFPTEPADERRFSQLLKQYRVKGEPPALFVGDAVLIGGELHIAGQAPLSWPSSEARTALEAELTRAIEEKALSPLARVELLEQLTIPAVVLAAAADSVNPCTFAVLVLLLGTLIVAGRRGKMLAVGASFISAIYITYFLMGLGIFTAIQTAGVQRPFILAVSSLAILLGLWNMKDYFAYGKWFTIEVPQRWRPVVKKLTSSAVTVPGAFAVGVLDSFFLLPCSSGPYIAILALLSAATTRGTALLYLLFYNLIFVLPLVIITLAINFGFTTTARAERWRSARLGKLHLVAGAVMFALGVGMIVALQLGYL
jgi:cytochrome c biogenesis protein CcdA/glutaredoxin